MSLTIQGTGTPAVESLYRTEKTGETKGSSKAAAMPDADKLPGGSPLGGLLSLPVLEEPAAPLSLDNLMKALADEARRQGVKSAAESIEVKGDKMEKLGQEKLDQLAKQIDEMAKQKVANGFMKAFQIIGAIIGAVASVAMIAVGAMTGNPALIVAGALGAVVAIDGAVSAATDGKASIAVGFTEAGKAMGMDDKAAGIFGTCVSMGIMLTSMVAGFAGAAASTGTKVASDIVTKAVDHAGALAKLAKFSAGAEIASGIVDMGSASTSIALAVIQNEIDQLKADGVDIDALLEELRQTMEMTEEFVESELEKVNELMADVKEIVDNCNTTQTAILTNAPSVA